MCLIPFDPHPTRLQCSNQKCNHVFKFSNVRYSIMNDQGVAVFKCPECGRRTKMGIHNTDIIMHARDCEKCIDIEDIDYHNELDSIPFGIYREDLESDEEQIDLPIKSFWRDNGRFLDDIADSELRKYKEVIDKECQDFHIAYLSGNIGCRAINRLLVKIDISTDEYFVFAKVISSEKDLSFSNLCFVGSAKSHLDQIADGVRDRDECFSILNSLLIRWNLFVREVFFVTPFIGFPYRNDNNDEHVRNFWNWLGKTLDLNKSTFVTRRISITRLTQAYDNQKETFEELKSWDMLNDLTVFAYEYDGRKKKYKDGYVKIYQQSHAKFYAGVFDDYVEVLSGSYNLQLGNYMENLTFKRYSKADFKKKFLDPYSFSYRHEHEGSEYIHPAIIEIRADGSIVNSESSDKYYNILNSVL